MSNDFIEKRSQVRHPLTGELTGRIVSSQSGSTIPCIAVDVSCNGLQVVMLLHPDPGTSLTLKKNGRDISMIVMWCRKDETRRGYFSVGLRTENESDDLLALFLKSNRV